MATVLSLQMSRVNAALVHTYETLIVVVIVPAEQKWICGSN
jgi:hypothetical protein